MSAFLCTLWVVQCEFCLRLCELVRFLLVCDSVACAEVASRLWHFSLKVKTMKNPLLVFILCTESASFIGEKLTENALESTSFKVNK